MPRAISKKLACLLASALVFAPSCSNNPPPNVSLHLPADTFDRADRPDMTEAALASEAEYERVIDARDLWAKSVARQLDAACRLLRATAAPALECRPERAEWEAP